MAETNEIVPVIERLNEEDRALVLAFANALLDRQMLRLPSFEPIDEAEWRAWIGRVLVRGGQVLAQEIDRLRAAGLANETGPLALLSLPEDMGADSDTSVET